MGLPEDSLLPMQGVGASGAPFVQRKQALGPNPELRRALLLAAARQAAVKTEVGACLPGFAHLIKFTAHEVPQAAVQAEVCISCRCCCCGCMAAAAFGVGVGLPVGLGVGVGVGVFIFPAAVLEGVHACHVMAERNSRTLLLDVARQEPFPSPCPAKNFIQDPGCIAGANGLVGRRCTDSRSTIIVQPVLIKDDHCRHQKLTAQPPAIQQRVCTGTGAADQAGRQALHRRQGHSAACSLYHQAS